MKYKIITNSSNILRNEFLSIIENPTSAKDWLNAFDEAEFVICLTTSNQLSKSYEYAIEAKHIYENKHKNYKVLVIDSYSCGPEIHLLTQKVSELIHSNKTYIEIRNTIMDYRQKTHLFFIQRSKLGFHILGKANYDGNLISIKKCMSLKHLYKEIASAGYQGGRFIVSHTGNIKLAQKIKKHFENDIIEITEMDFLCSSLLKKDGILLGFEV